MMMYAVDEITVESGTNNLDAVQRVHIDRISRTELERQLGRSLVENVTVLDRKIVVRQNLQNLQTGEQNSLFEGLHRNR
ncbi:MAG: hypothetical protein IID46_04225 [Planctomycetes bacterium]|nr:hypothetical protein [Planctomycetota bacterium]